MDTVIPPRLDTIYQVMRDTVAIFSHHLLNKDIGWLEIITTFVSIATLIIVAVNARQSYKLFKLNNNAFEAAYRPYCSVRMPYLSKRVDSTKMIMRLLFSIKNTKDTFVEITQLRYYLYNEKNGTEFIGLSDSFTIGALQEFAIDPQLPSEVFSKYDKFAVEIEYVGATGNTYHHLAYYTYEYRSENNVFNGDEIRFEFHPLRYDTREFDRKIKLILMDTISNGKASAVIKPKT